MRSNPVERLIHIGHRILRMRGHLCKLPYQDGLPGAFRALLSDPTIQLSETFDSFCGWPEAVEVLEEQTMDGRMGEWTRERGGEGARGRGSEEARETRGQGDKGTRSEWVSGEVGEWEGGQVHSPLTHPLTYSLTHSPTHLLTHSLTHSPLTTHQSPLTNHASRFIETTSLHQSVVPIEMTQPSSTPSPLAAMFPSLSTVFRTMDALNIPTGGQAEVRGHEHESGFNKSEVGDKRIGRMEGKEGRKDAKVQRCKYANEEMGLHVSRNTQYAIHNTPHGSRFTPQSAIESPVLTGSAEALSESASTPIPIERSEIPGSRADVSQAIPPDGVQMVQSASRLAAVLRANIGAEEISAQPPQSQEGIGRASMPAMESVEPIAHFPEGTIEPNLKDQSDIEELMEKLADELEFEFIRTYGTSGR